MIPAIQELNFPKKDGKQYATLTHATATLADMGEKTIATQVKIDGDIVPDFSRDWEVEFQGEKYIMPLRIPQGTKENTSLNSTIDLTFQHWAIYQLKRWPFVTMQPIVEGTAIADEEVASVQLNLKDFCDLFGQVLDYYYGDTITIYLNPAWLYDNAPTLITIDHTYIWNVLIDAFHDKYGVRWAIEPREDNDNKAKGGERYVIKVGYPTTEVDHIFEYGFEGGLLKVERQVQSEEIHNMIKGRGGETNIPFRYFKDKDPKNPDFKPDPDWVEELANIYITNLRGATFRSYVQGWKAAHISKYPGYKAVGENNAYAPWAYRKGYTDTKFHPVEFVADEITINSETGDRYIEILPGFTPCTKRGSSIDKYGALPATLDNNDDIYPTIQGTGLDIVVDVEQIKSDNVEESVEDDAVVSNFENKPAVTVAVESGQRKTIELKSDYFYVSEGKHANLDEGPKTFIIKEEINEIGNLHFENGRFTLDVNTFTIDADGYVVVVEDATLLVVNAVTGEVRSASGIPAGAYYFLLRLSLHNTTKSKLYITVSCENPKVTSSTLVDDSWRNTFDIWVKDIWNSRKGIDEDGNPIKETNEQYAERVWKPVLGDREGNEAAVVFTSGALAHEDYEFKIPKGAWPVYDTSKTYKDADGVTHTSHWRIKLAKSDAELETTGLYVPSTQKQGKAGDTFAFVGTEMTHVPYVVDAEIRLDDWKKDRLGEVKEIKPTFVVTTDRIKLNSRDIEDNERLAFLLLDSGGKILMEDGGALALEGSGYASLLDKLHPGDTLRLADKRFIEPLGGRAYETLYLQSITYTYREPSSDDAALNPDVEIVLSDKYTTSANPVTMMQGEISALQRQVGAISNIEQIVRAVGDKLYLRKDGIPDRSLSSTQFFSLLTSGDFRAGIVGGAGWGFYKDDNGNWVLEADRVNVRQEMQANTLVINQAEGRGGMEIDTAAFMEVTRVVEADNGYVCYFDQKNGTVANLFHVDDVAYCNRWTPDNQELKFYKRRVTAVGIDNITLSETDVNGTGIPAEKDNIIHFGNYTDKTRQYVKVRDVVGGGYERYIEELNSVNAEGVEYYFVGKQAGESRWFVGNKDLVPYSGKGDGSYIEYINRRFNLNNVTLSINTTVGDKTLKEVLEGVDASEYLRRAFPQDTEITGGVIMSTLLSLGYKDAITQLRHTLAGMNGAWDKELGGKTIATWWGGKPVDRELAPEGTDLTDTATGLVRMDGSGYLAKGLIRWNADGSGSVANGVISWDTAGRVTLGSGVTIDVAGAAGLQSTLGDILQFINGISKFLVPAKADGTELAWAQYAQGELLKARTSLFASGGLSALGLAPDITGGASGGGASVELLTDWTHDPGGKALAATLGVELHADVDTALKTSQSAERTVRNLDKRLDRTRRWSADRRLRRGLIPLTAEPGMIYRNLGLAVLRLPGTVGTRTIDLSQHLGTAGTTCTVRLVGGKSSLAFGEVSADTATMTRNGANVTVIVHQAYTPYVSGKTSSLLLVVNLNGRAYPKPWLVREANGIITDTDWDAPLHEPMPPRPTLKELLSIFKGSETSPAGFELQRRRRYLTAYKPGLKTSNIHQYKWVRPALLSMGVWRARRRTRRGYTSEWVYCSVNLNKEGNARSIKILG